MKPARTWNDVKHRPSVHDAFITDDDGVFDGSKNYWVYLKPGYICTESECGIIHEPTVKQVLYLLNHCVIKTV